MDYATAVKVVFIDGNLSNGNVRTVQCEIIDEDEHTITILSKDGKKFTIGKSVIIKITPITGGSR